MLWLAEKTGVIGRDRVEERRDLGARRVAFDVLQVGR